MYIDSGFYFKTIFEQCRTIDDVRAKFSGQELIQRLEDVKKLFGNRVIHKGRNQEKTVENYIEGRTEILGQRLPREPGAEINHATQTQPTVAAVTGVQQTTTSRHNIHETFVDEFGVTETTVSLSNNGYAKGVHDIFKGVTVKTVLQEENPKPSNIPTNTMKKTRRNFNKVDFMLKQYILSLI